MFTDFIAECRAEKLKVNVPTSDPMGAARVDAALRAASQPAVAPETVKVAA